MKTASEWNLKEYMYVVFDNDKLFARPQVFNQNAVQPACEYFIESIKSN